MKIYIIMHKKNCKEKRKTSSIKQQKQMKKRRKNFTENTFLRGFFAINVLSIYTNFKGPHIHDFEVSSSLQILIIASNY